MQQPIDLDERFDYHAPDENRTKAHEAMRRAMKIAATQVLGIVPPGREQSLAITALEEAMMWANAGIARKQSDYAVRPPR